MHCENCGTKLEDGQLTCSQCGAQINQEPVKEQPAEAIVQETTQTEFAQPQFEEIAQKPKKKRGGLIAAIIAVVLAVAVAMGMFLDPIKGMAIKAFGSGDNYLSFAAEKSVKNASAEIAEAYGKYLKELEQAQTAGGAEMSVQLNVGEKAVDLLESALEESGVSGIDLAWFQNISVDMDADVKESAAKIAMALKLNGKDLANVEGIVDLDKGDVFLAVLSMSDKYLKTTLDISEEMAEVMDAADLTKAMPSEEVVAGLMEKYAAVFYNNLENVEKTSEVLTVGDVQQKLTALNVELDAYAAQKIAIAVLETIETDAELKQIINDVAKLLKEQELLDDAEQIYDDFLEQVKDAKKSLQDVEDADEKLKLTFYVDGSHEIVGCKAAFEEESVCMITVRDGEKFACKLDADTVEILGEGTEKKEVVSGKYTIKVDGEKVCEITMQDLSTKNDLLNGKIAIAPSSDLLKNAGMDSIGASAVSLMNLKLEYVFESKKDSTKVDVNLVSGEDLLLGITVSGKETEAGEIQMPGSDKVIKDENAYEWLQTLDIEGLLDKLKDAGVPESLLQGLFG